ncbi:hypothetical protein PVAP13_7KG399902 [Panicum virgatum]|uniref:Uncharacterized protein n=1 Tax=Panicum virgatum TaxID=38727 RepID=A0A8T0QDA4_PANVG|nr:hypothetical protein PVAP13_7KG399902 [Panicum virgatum]
MLPRGEGLTRTHATTRRSASPCTAVRPPRHGPARAGGRRRGEMGKEGVGQDGREAAHHGPAPPRSANASACTAAAGVREPLLHRPGPMQIRPLPPWPELEAAGWAAGASCERGDAPAATEGPMAGPAQGDERGRERERTPEKEEAGARDSKGSSHLAGIRRRPRTSTCAVPLRGGAAHAPPPATERESGDWGGRERESRGGAETEERKRKKKGEEKREKKNKIIVGDG